jgi:ribosomal protein S18 acetylase RimI-like enzyme
MTTRTLEAPVAESDVEGDGIEIREAVASDNEALLELTSLTPMEGTIALRIDREPDFFALPRARGEAVVFVATYGERVVGCMSAAIHAAYIGGVAERIAHATDLKVHREFNGRRLGARLIRRTEAYLRDRGVDLTFNLVADGNERVMRLSHGRHGTPVPVMLGRFFVDQLVASPFRVRSKKYRVERASEDDLAEIAAMLDHDRRERSFAPPVTAANLEDATAQAPAGRFRKMLVVRDSGRVIATLTIEDTQDLRQNVLIGLPWSIHLALGVLRLLALPVRGLRIPRLGGPLAILYVRWMACAEGHEPALRALLSEARAEAFRRRFIFLSVGLHERDPLRSVVSGIPRLTFTSRAMATSLIRPDRVQGLVDQTPFEDFALV